VSAVVEISIGPIARIDVKSRGASDCRKWVAPWAKKTNKKKQKKQKKQKTKNSNFL
jgi:hypothetical protein